ncbi:MAG: hypothetical protein R3337_00185 [Gammaproteobacteria bacterium]|nr:hypothetical protein [Gammaproteobacteria bacterium]
MTEPRPPWGLTVGWARSATTDRLEDTYIRLRILQQKFERDAKAPPGEPPWTLPHPYPSICEAWLVVRGELESRKVELPDVADVELHDGMAWM